VGRYGWNQVNSYFIKPFKVHVIKNYPKCHISKPEDISIAFLVNGNE
jgi:hypothetical protein